MNVSRQCELNITRPPGCRYDNEGRSICQYDCRSDRCNGADILPDVSKVGFTKHIYIVSFIGNIVLIILSQSARQGLAVLMASAIVVLTYETSTLRQRHNFILIDFKFGVGDYVQEVTNPDKVGSGPMSGRDAT